MVLSGRYSLCFEEEKVGNHVPEDKNEQTLAKKLFRDSNTVVDRRFIEIYSLGEEKEMSIMKEK